MNIRRDLTGQKFNHLTVLNFSHKGKSGHSYWKCQCSCKKEIVAKGIEISHGQRKSCGCHIRTSSLRLDLENKKFNDLLVIRPIEKYRHEAVYWLCRCNCGKEIILRGSRIYNNKVKHCGCKRKSWNNKTVGELTGRYWAHLKIGAKNRKIKVNVTMQEAWELFERQQGCCIFTGKKLTHMKYGGKKHGKDITIKGTASLDRIDSSKPYSKENCQWVHKAIQKMKNNLPDDKFIKWCKEIIDYRN